MAKCTQQSFFNLEKYTLVKVVKMVVFLRIQHQLDIAWDIWEDRSEECSAGCPASLEQAETSLRAELRNIFYSEKFFISYTETVDTVQ